MYLFEKKKTTLKKSKTTYGMKSNMDMFWKIKKICDISQHGLKSLSIVSSTLID